MTDNVSHGAYAADSGPPGTYAGETGAHGAYAATPVEDQRPVGELVSDVTRTLSTLMRQELELAKAELRQEAVKAGKGAGFLGGAGFAGWMLALFFSLAIMWALGEIMHLFFAALIVAVLWAIVAAVLFFKGRAEMRSVNPVPEKTVETLKEDAEWAKTLKS